MRTRLISAYRDLVTAGAIQADPAQEAMVAALQRLTNDLRGYRPGGLASLFGRPPAPPRGLYLFGPVGRGKTMLMDLFFQVTRFAPKRRLHFDAFMAEAHAAMDTARQTSAGDPIPGAAREIAAKSLLLCIDDFQVNDIADAMILGRLFEQLFKAGVVLVATSNTAPQDLYPDGINRALFLPFIAMLREHVDVAELAARQDYRLSKLAGRRLYFTPNDTAAKVALREAWSLLTGNAIGRSRQIDVHGHRLSIPRVAEGTAWATFEDLCGKPLGAADFRALAGSFHTLILEGIPILRPENRNEARRFIILIDTLYDERVRLIASAEAEPDDLYPTGDGSEAFRRTASRLVEMRSEDYLKAPRPAPGQLVAVGD